MTFTNSTGSSTNVPVQWTAATLNTNTNQYETSIIKAYHSIHLLCMQTKYPNELEFKVFSQQGNGLTSPSAVVNPYQFWVSQQFTFDQDYDSYIFTFLNGTKQLFLLKNVGKTDNSTDFSQEFSITIPASITI